MKNLALPSFSRNRSRSSSNASTASLSVPSQHNPQPAVDFAIRVEQLRKLYTGRNGNDESVSYVPHDELRAYWTDVKVRELSQAYTPHLTIKYELVSQRCLRLFSVLVYTNRVQYFDAVQAKVSDEQLPLAEDNLPQPLKSPVFKDVLEDICQHQWIFCPLVLDYARLTDVELQVDHILPFHHVEKITEGDAAHIFKVKIHKSCNRLHPNDEIRGIRIRGDTPSDGVYVLKSYQDERYRRLFLNESKALTTLHHKAGNEHIVGYYGSFIQNGKFNLLLQFANAGSLLEYYRNPAVHPPKDPDAICQFWKSLLGILKGLHQVHQIRPKNDDLGEFRGIHEDIKPDNILLNRTTTSKSVYDFTPLLTDFGHSHFRVPKEAEDQMGLDLEGNQTYGAPEVSKHAGYLRKLPSQIPTAADIWSMGCLMSDAAAWVVLGRDGREDYRRLREEVGSKVKNFEDEGHYDCFHDATNRSEAVDKMHARIRQACHPEDTVTPQLLDVVQNHMLVKDWKRRWTANEVYEWSYRTIWKSEGKMSGKLKELTTVVQTNVESVAKRMYKSATPHGKTGEAKEDSQQPEVVPGTAGTSRPPVAEPDDEHHQQTPPIKLSASPNMPPGPGSGLHTALSRLPDDLSPSGESHVPGFLSPTSETSSLLSPHTEPEPGGNYIPRPPSPALSVSSTYHPVRDVNDLVRSNLSLEEAKTWRSDWKNYRQLHPDRHRLIRELQHTLKGRDHIFFVDDSRTMKAHASEIEEALETLAYIVKPRDGKDASGSVSLAIGTTSSSASAKKQKTLHTNSSQTSKLVDILKEQCAYERIETVIEDVLSDFIDKEIMPRLPPDDHHRDSLSAEVMGKSSGSPVQRSTSTSRKRTSSHSTPNINPISVIVFTNGQWGDGKAGAGVDHVIKRLTDQLKVRELKRTQVVIQFLRFGDDEDGIRHLEYLAGLGRESSDEYKGYSIVDTQPITGSVCSMLIGSIGNSHITGRILKETAQTTSS
ncbi:Protein kinase-like domain containing protein [Naviculisporaceae sp. PSN 640]